MTLVMTRMINTLYKQNEFKPFIVYGPLGIGKSAYAMKAVAEVYGGKDQLNWEAVKERLVFHPRGFVERCTRMVENGERDRVLIWDDAGLWLNALEWNNPFVRAVTKYLSVARTNWASIIFTSPLPTHVVQKLRGLPDCVTVKIIKKQDDTTSPERYRLAKGYRFWVAPDMKKSGVRQIFEDNFTAILPNSVYYWYKPLRDQYAKEAVMYMRREFASLQSTSGGA
jgi:hypothetical protein